MPEKNPIDVVVENAGPVTIASVVGPVDSATIDVFKDKMEAVCAKGGTYVVLDCKQMSYANSRAIGLLMKFHRGLVMTRGRFVLCSLNPKVARAFDLLQIGKSLTIFGTREEAVASLTKS